MTYPAVMRRLVTGRVERRACERFVVPGATVFYREEGLIFTGKYSPDSFPVFDISRGGLRFLSQSFLKVNTKLTLKLIVPGEESPIVLLGSVSWLSPNPERSYKYQVGVQFAPYGRKKGDNSSESLDRLAALEQRTLKNDQ